MEKSKIRIARLFSLALARALALQLGSKSWQPATEVCRQVSLFAIVPEPKSDNLTARLFDAAIDSAKIMKPFAEYIPIATSVLSVFFAIEIFAHWRVRRTTYLLWWTIGVVTFALGTATESINVLFGWSLVNFKVWYIVGALLGGFPLAQGSVYLLASRRFADISACFFVSLILIASVCVVLSPVSLPANFNGKLSGSVFGWQWVRSFSPFINSYAFIFLVGGAIYSAVKYALMKNKQARLIGNVFIAIGAILPGIGGSFTRMGHVNVLFVTELIGLALIYAGYRIIKADKLSADAIPDRHGPNIHSHIRSRY